MGGGRETWNMSEGGRGFFPLGKSPSETRRRSMTKSCGVNSL